MVNHSNAAARKLFRPFGAGDRRRPVRMLLVGGRAPTAMSTDRVVVTDHDFDDLGIEREVLGGVATVEAVHDAPAGHRGGYAPALATADAVLNLRYTLDGDAFDAMDACRIVARYGVGVDNVDCDAARRRGCWVTNVPDYCVEEVATHAVAAWLSLERGLSRYDDDVAAGGWDRDAAGPLRRLTELTVGVVGYGAIGRAVGRRVAALGPDVLASDPYLSPDDLAGEPGTLVAFETLLDRADAISLHTPLTDDTEGLVDAGAIDRLSNDAYLVNVARGELVDLDAVVAALGEGSIAGAALDVFPTEPPGDEHPLRDHDRVLTTPHVAWYSDAANAERRRRAAENVRAVLVGERPENAVVDPTG